MLPHDATAELAAAMGSQECRRCERDGVRPRRSSRQSSLLRHARSALVLLLCATTSAVQAAAPEESQQLEPAEAPLASADVARAALTADHRSLLELHQLQLRENELWGVRNAVSMTGPGIGLGLGAAGAAMGILFGSAALAAADRGEFADDNPARESFRTMGGALIGLGVAATLVALYCGIRVRDLRQTKRTTEAELSAIRLQRIRTIDALTLPSEPPHAH